ncbi:MAG: hypothetical protein V2A74_14020 [bacterium]
MTNRSRFYLFQCLVGLVAVVLFAMPAPAQDLTFSMGENSSPGGTAAADHEILAHTGSSTYIQHLSSLTSALPANVDLDALDYVNYPDNIYFSLDCDTTLSGAGAVADEDVIKWNGSAFSLAWDGSSNGLPSRVDLDALDVISEGPLVFSFSLDASANLTGPGLVEDEDLVRWNGSAFAASLDFDGSAEGVPSRLDLNAFSRMSGLEWVMSFDATATVDSVTFEDEDLATFNTGSATFTGLFFDGSAEGVASAVDLDAAEATPGQVPVKLGSLSLN